MPDWFLNPALTRFRQEVNARWPHRDKGSDGTIGDAAHQSRSSDHNPDPDGSVDAWDMDVDGVPVAQLKQVFQAHEASKYWVHNDQISFRDEGWRPRSYAYAGPNRNRHTQHCHWNTRESHENSTKPWFPTPAPEGLFMALSDAEQNEALGILRTIKRLGEKETFSDGSTRFADVSIAEAASGVLHGKTIGGGGIYLAAQFEAVRSQLDNLLAAVGQVDEELIAKLGASNGLTAVEKADLLRPVLGDDAAAVGVLLQG